MKTFKKAAISAALLVAALGASASAAEAATQVDATGTWSASAGTTQFVVGSTRVVCTTSTATGNLSSAVGVGGSTSVDLNFTGCTAFGSVSATVNCGVVSLNVGAFPTATTATGTVSLPNRVCTITTSTCTIRIPDPGSANNVGSGTLDSSSDTLTLAPLTLPYTASSSLGCGGISTSGNGTFGSGSSGAPGNVTYSQTSGTSWSIS